MEEAMYFPIFILINMKYEEYDLQYQTKYKKICSIFCKYFFFSVLSYKWYAIYNLIETANKNKCKKYNIMSGNFSYL